MTSPTPDHWPWAATRGALAAELGQLDGVLPGTVVRRRLPCGKQRCACKANPPTLHGPHVQWTRTVQGKTVTRVLSEEELARYQPWIDTARRLKELSQARDALRAGTQGRTPRPARRHGQAPGNRGQPPAHDPIQHTRAAHRQISTTSSHR